MSEGDTILEELSHKGFTVEKKSDNSVEVSLSGGLKIAGEGALLEAWLENDLLIIRNKTKNGINKIKIDNPKEAHIALYYMWLEAFRPKTARITSITVKAGRKTAPKNTCIKELEKRGIQVKKEDCPRILAGLIYSLASYIAISKKPITLESINSSIIIPPGRLGESYSARMSALLSTLRVLLTTVSRPSIIFDTAIQLHQEYNIALLYSKTGLNLGFYIDRMPVSWPCLLPGLLHLDIVIRQAYPCKSLALSEMGVQGEALWIETGDGSISCRPGSSLSTGLGMLYSSRLGAYPIIAERDMRGMKCISLGYPECREASLVVMPDERGLQRLAILYGYGYKLRLYYYRNKLLAAYARKGEEPGLEILSIGEDLGGSPIRAWLASKNHEPIEAKPHAGLKPSALSKLENLARLL